MVKKKKSKFKGKMGAYAKKKKTQGSSYGYLNIPKGVNIFKETPGSRLHIDILPYIVSNEHHPDRDADQEIALPGEEWWHLPFKIHRGIGANNETVVCPSSFGKRCPICEYRSNLTKNGGDKKEIDALRPSKRVLYNVIPLDSKDHDPKIHIWDISEFNFEQLLLEEVEEQEEYENFPDLEEGATVYVRFSSETGFTNKPYAKASKIDFKERDEQYDRQILDDVADLDEVLQVMSYKQLEAFFFEMDPDSATDEELVEDEPKKPARKKKKVEPEEDEPDNEPEDEPKKPIRKKKKVEPEEEEEEAAPRRKKPARKKKPEPEEEPEEDEPEEEPEEDEPEEEPEEEEEKPTPRRKKNAKKKASDDPECPYGHTFGEDCEEFDDCDECELWDQCYEKKEELEG